jgi:hypothetical protein
MFIIGSLPRRKHRGAATRLAFILHLPKYGGSCAVGFADKGLSGKCQPTRSVGWFYGVRRMERLQSHFLPPFRWLALLPIGNGSRELEAGRQFLRGNAAVAEFSGNEGIGLRKPWA